MGLISIIIPTYNRVKTLDLCLNEITNQIQHLKTLVELEIIVSNIVFYFNTDKNNSIDFKMQTQQ